MRTSLLSIAALAGLASANIKFHWVNPTCDINSTGPDHCLKGQVCSADNKCVCSCQMRNDLQC